MSDTRLTQLGQWLQASLPTEPWTLKPLAGDASFRRYFRIQQAGQSWIAMDAPPGQEDIRPFMAIAQGFARAGIQVPDIIAVQQDHGFLLLKDLGDDLYLSVLQDHNAELLYQNALLTLQQIQRCKEIPNWTLPHFDQALILREWELFDQWLLAKHWQIQTTFQEQKILSTTLEFLSQEILAQPQVCVHRDYHSRNLLQLANNQVGVLDFQDAVWGPIAYDAVSLLRDCYIAWPRAKVEKWALQHYQHCNDSGVLTQISSELFMRWFDLLGIQRHLKAVGIFARLNHLYAKPGYLKDIPRSLDYILQVSANYAELTEFRQLLQRWQLDAATF